jgi:hypothetical protein
MHSSRSCSKIVRSPDTFLRIVLKGQTVNYFAKVNQSPFISRIFSRSLKQINKFVSSLTFCGFVPLQTIESWISELLSGACENEDLCVR